MPSGVLVGVSRLLSTLRSVFVRVLDRILTVSGPGCQLPVLVRRSDGGEDCSQALVRFVGGSYWVSVICGPPAFHPRVRSRMLPFGFQSRNPSVVLVPVRRVPIWVSSIRIDADPMCVTRCHGTPFALF